MCNDITIFLICSTPVRMPKLNRQLHILMQFKLNLTLIINLDALFVIQFKTDRGVSYVRL